MTVYAAFDIFPRAKGSSTHIAAMVQAMERRFGEVHLLCLGAPGMAERERVGWVTIHRYGRRHRDYLRRATGFARFVADRVARLRPRLAVFRDPWGGYPLLRTAPECPAIFEVNALPSWELEYARPAVRDNAALRAKLRDLERRCLRGAAGVFCVSSVTRRALAEEGVDAEVVPNLADEVFFAVEPRPDPLSFGYIGGLQPWQGLESLIDAFALAAPSLPGVRLEILRGDSRGEIARHIARRQMQDRVQVKAPLAAGEVAGWLSRQWFTVAPLADTLRNTVQGCCPVKLVESMAAGVPVIASDLAVCREWMREGEGLLVEAQNARLWALAIRRLFGDRELRDRLADNARKRARQVFSAEVVEERLGRMFERISTGGDGCRSRRPN